MRHPKYKDERWRDHGCERRIESPDGDDHVGLAAVRPEDESLAVAVVNGWAWSEGTQLITGTADDANDEALLTALYAELFASWQEDRRSEPGDIDSRAAAFCARTQRMYVRPWLHAEPDLYLHIVGHPTTVRDAWTRTVTRGFPAMPSDQR